MGQRSPCVLSRYRISTFLKLFIKHTAGDLCPIERRSLSHHMEIFVPSTAIFVPSTVIFIPSHGDLCPIARRSLSHPRWSLFHMHRTEIFVLSTVIFVPSTEIFIPSTEIFIPSTVIFIPSHGDLYSIAWRSLSHPRRSLFNPRKACGCKPTAGRIFIKHTEIFVPSNRYRCPVQGNILVNPYFFLRGAGGGVPGHWYNPATGKCFKGKWNMTLLSCFFSNRMMHNFHNDVAKKLQNKY